MTLDEDVAQEIRQRMRERGTGLKQTINDLIRRGLRSADSVEPYETPTFAMGARSDLDLDRALALSASMEDEELLHKLDLRK